MLLIDAHVHLHDCFDSGEFFESALCNFIDANRIINSGQEFQAILLFAATRKSNSFRRLFEYAYKKRDIPSSLDGWAIFPTEERAALFLQRKDDNHGVFLIAGRQLNTKENLEVLALATDEEFADGFALETSLQRVRESGGVPVIPWGFGKWMGQRRTILMDILTMTGEDATLFIGDNGGRPEILPSSIFKMAKEKGIPILPGSDPLPLESEFSRVGSFGFSVPGSISHDYPARDLKKKLLARKNFYKKFGKPENPLRFMLNQIRIRVGKKYK